MLNHPTNYFLQKAKERLNQELDRLLNYLDESTESKLIATFLDQYVAAHATTLLINEGSGLVHMIKHQKYGDLALMYEMFARVPQALSIMKKMLSDYLTGEGTVLIINESLKPDQFINSIMVLRDSAIRLLHESFQRNLDVDITIKTAFESFINKDNKTAINLVYYLDDLFKKEFKQMSDDQVPEKMDKCISIFRYLEDKDVFEGFYKISLAKRLLDLRGTHI